MIPFTQELLSQRFKHRYYRMLLKMSGMQAIRENMRETGKLPRIMSWGEVLQQHRINRFAPIIYDCSLEYKILDRWNFYPLPKKRKPPMSKDIEVAVKEILVEEFDCTDEMISSKSRMRLDLGLDEFEMIELAGSLESRFNIVIDSDQYSALETIEELVRYLVDKGAIAPMDSEL